MSDMQARIQLSKQNKKSKKGAKSPSLQNEGQKEKSLEKKEQIKSPNSQKSNELLEMGSPVKVVSKKYDPKPEVNKRQINNLQK